MPYFYKQQLKLSATFEENASFVKPETVICKVSNEKGEISEPSIVEDSTGHYHALIELTGHGGGTWYYRFEGHGTHIGAAEKPIQVEPSPFY